MGSVGGKRERSDGKGLEQGKFIVLFADELIFPQELQKSISFGLEVLSIPSQMN